MKDLDGRARLIGLRYAILGILLAGIVPILLVSPQVLRFWYLPWWRQLAIGATGVVVVVWLGAPWAFHSIAKRRDSRSPVWLALLAFVSGGFAGSASTLFVEDVDINLSSFSTYVVGPVCWLLLVGAPLCIGLGVLYRRSIRSSMGRLSPHQG
ncbi:MAG TPA: hypothetical protein VLQ45_23485 [Thermoanaerobaculia bacterium]|nr:hypothetical protein [Thermoanaerobaculia bacterium]